MAGNPLIILGDKLARKPYLLAFMQTLRTHNNALSAETALNYAVCADSTQVAVTLKKFLGAVKMILIGSELAGNGVTVARMLAKKAHIVMVVDPAINPLGHDPLSHQAIQKNLEEMGITLVYVNRATEDFFLPIVKDRVLSGVEPDADLKTMTPEERAVMIDKRLDAINKFPSLPETQRKVAALDDLDPPKKWAAAINPDLPTRTVILRILNSGRYSFRTRVETIDQAVALASTKTIREIVTACQIRQLFSKTNETTIDQFWRHSLAVGFYAKLLSLPADPSAQSGLQKSEFDRFGLDQEEIAVLQRLQLWTKFDLGEKDDPFIAGLMHDIGKVTMLMCMEDSLELVSAVIASEVEEAEKENKMWAHSIIEIERFLMKDIDHQVIGNRLGEKWELDSGIHQAIAHHHDIQEHSPDFLKLVALADLAANTLFPYPATEEQHPLPKLFVRLAAAIKKSSAKTVDEGATQAINEDIHEDLVDVLNRLSISEHLWQIVDFKAFFHLCYMLTPKIRSVALSFLQQTA